jgi:hypothetical protein
VEPENFARYCRNGVLVSDLLNKIAGKTTLIKGINRNPTSITAINANFDKIMSYLKEFPRFSSRYLWAQNLIISGVEDVIWGLLDDIWYWHHGKTSPFDPAAQKQTNDNLKSTSTKS